MVEILDTTLREGELNPGVYYTSKMLEEIGLVLARLHTSRIEYSVNYPQRGGSTQVLKKIIGTIQDSYNDSTIVIQCRALQDDINIAQDSIMVKAAPLKGVELDLNRTPDALPAMAVTAAFAEGTTRLVNVPQARSKETDRIKCMAEELKKMAVDVEELPDGLIIHGGKPEPAELNGRSDHRIVMALALAGLAIEGKTTVDTAEAISVTFPNYVQLMKSIGADIQGVDAN